METWFDETPKRQRSLRSHEMLWPALYFLNKQVMISAGRGVVTWVQTVGSGQTFIQREEVETVFEVVFFFHCLKLSEFRVQRCVWGWRGHMHLTCMA